MQTNWMILLFNLHFSLLMIQHWKVKPHPRFLRIWVVFSVETHDLTRQLNKKLNIFNYYYSFLKLIGVWNKVWFDVIWAMIRIDICFSFMLHILTMEFIIQNKFFNNLERNYNAQKHLLKRASEFNQFSLYFYVIWCLFLGNHFIYKQPIVRHHDKIK